MVSFTETLTLKSVQCLNALSTLAYVSDQEVLDFYEDLYVAHEYPMLYHNVMHTIHGDNIDLTIDGWSLTFYKIIVNDLAGLLTREDTTLEELPTYHYGIGRSLIGLAILLEQKLIRHDQLRIILQDLMSSQWVGHDIETYLLQAEFLNEVTGDLAKIIRQIILENPKAVAEVKSGKNKAIGSLMGKILKQYKGDPKVVQETLAKLIDDDAINAIITDSIST